MKIISLNVNNFGGISNKPLIKDYKNWTEWKDAVDKWRDSNYERICSNVNNIVECVKRYEIVVLQEVDTNCSSFTKLKAQSEKNDFVIVYPNGTDETTFFNGRNSITCILVKSYLQYNKPICNFSNKQYKNVEIEVGKLRIIGVHISKGDIEYWKKLIVMCNNYKNEKVLVIGDMNVCDFGTPQKEKYFELLNIGMIDSWVEKGKDMNKITCNTGKRLDYALVSHELMLDIYDVDIIDKVRNNGYTDHSAIVVLC